MRFEWDEKKSIENIIKHKVSFEEASTIFFNNFLEIPDLEYSEDEDRFTAFGISALERELFVCYCYKTHINDNDIIRIISARKATKKEKEEFYNER